ncbi:MAG: hypothetical protein JJ900_17645 [Rhodospirillales bacterium]|nr:hypothetical protein [Rhodospirillales bacterium]MBO6788675.1 hypothetical protein [Rhodospirillales bacterium]
MSETLPEVAVRDAPPKIATIYERIMETTGVGSPALIYRHFAVFPGLLEWVWETVGPELESGRAISYALDAVSRTPVVPLPAVNIADMRADGVDAEAHRTVDAMLATYNRMNPVNLSLITAIRDLVNPTAAPADVPPPPPAPAAPTASPMKLPAPVNLQEMPDDLRETVLALSAAIPSPGTQVIPTLYRHLAIWPDFLRRLAPGLLEAMSRGDVEKQMDTLNANMRPLIADVAGRARDAAAPPLDDPAAMVRTLDSFLYTIPQLVVVGTALRAALPVYEA